MIYMQLSTITLDRAEPDKLYTVTEIRTEPAMTRRLRELGLIPGTDISLRRTNWGGAISSYMIRGAQIAFRRETAKRIAVSEHFSGRADNEP